MSLDPTMTSGPDAVPPPSRLLNRRRRRKARISLTPLIDVVFILLVFFMLASSLVDWQAIDMNARGNNATRASMDGALLVEVRVEDLRLSGETLDLEKLATRVRHRLIEKPDQRVLVKVGAGVLLQDTIGVLDRLTEAGAQSVSMIRDPEA